MGGWQPGYKLGMREGGEVTVGQVQKMIKNKGTLVTGYFSPCCDRAPDKK